MIDLFEDNEFIGERTKRPASAPVGWLAGRQGDEVGFIFVIEFAFVLSVGVAAMDRRNPSVNVALVCAVGR